MSDLCDYLDRDPFERMEEGPDEEDNYDVAPGDQIREELVGLGFPTPEEAEAEYDDD